MLIRLVLAALIIISVFWFMRKIRSNNSEQDKKSLFYIACYGVALFLVFAVLTGKLHWIGAVFAGLLAFTRFGVGLLTRLPILGFLRNHKVFGNPVFRTPYVEVKIDLHTYSFSGSILSGPHAGKDLNGLSLDELKELEVFYHHKDMRSYYLIRVLIQQGGAKHGHSSHQQSSNEQQNQQHYSSLGDPSVEEALLILGLNGAPSKKDIVTAHRSLIQKLHPDRGGNDYLASRVNVAKDVLLNQFDKK